jgi:hypothetical protein
MNEKTVSPRSNKSGVPLHRTRDGVRLEVPAVHLYGLAAAAAAVSGGLRFLEGWGPATISGCFIRTCA